MKNRFQKIGGNSGNAGNSKNMSYKIPGNAVNAVNLKVLEKCRERRERRELLKWLPPVTGRYHAVHGYFIYVTIYILIIYASVTGVTGYYILAQENYLLITIENYPVTPVTGGTDKK